MFQVSVYQSVESFNVRNKLKGEQLHNLIISLSQSEKNQITRYLNRSVNPDKICIHLYRKMVEMPVFDEEALLDMVYPEQSRRLARFESSCDYLAQLIATALAAKDPHCFSWIPFIQKTMEKKLFKLAYKNLVQALKTAWEREQIPELYRLSLQAKELQHLTALDARGKAKVPAHQEIFQILGNSEFLATGWEEVRSIAHRYGKMGAEEQENLYSTLTKWLHQVNELQVHTDSERQGRLRILVRCQLMLRQFESALESQWELVNLGIRSDIPVLAERRITEMGTLLNLLYHNNSFQEARQMAMRLRATPAINPEQERERLRYLVKAGFNAALCTGDEAMGKQALTDLERRYQDIPLSKKASLYFYAALFGAYTGNWQETVRWLNQLLALPQKQRTLFTWQVPMLMAIAAIELEDYEMASTYQQRMRRISRHSGMELPNLVGKGLRRMLNVPANESRLILAQLRENLIQALEKPAEKRAAQYFNPLLWVDARLKRKMIIDIARDEDFRSFREYHRIQSA